MAFSFAGAQKSLEGIREREREDQLREEDLALTRKNSLFQLALVKEKAISDSKTSDKYRSAVGDTIKLQNRIKKADLNEEELDFFKPILEDPFASADIMKFIDTQKKDGVDIRVSDIPTMMTIVEANAPVQEKMDYIKVITGVDLTDEDQYYKIARQINAITTTVGRTIFTDTKPGVGVDFEQKEKRQQKMVDIIGYQIEPMARAFVANNPNPNDASVRRIQAALNNLGGNNAKQAMHTLMTEFLKPVKFKELMKKYPEEFKGAETNPYLPPILFLPDNLD